MSNKEEYAYYLIRKYHEKITGKTDPCSFHELLFQVEAPSFFSGINIWEYVERISIKDLKGYYENISFEKLKISKDESEAYPHYELLFNMLQNFITQPLIIEDIDGNFIPIEGRHRLRIMMLLNFLENRYPEIPCVVVKRLCYLPVQRIPEKYNEWQQYLSYMSLSSVAKETKRKYAQLLRNQ